MEDIFQDISKYYAANIIDNSSPGKDVCGGCEMLFFYVSLLWECGQRLVFFNAGGSFRVLEKEFYSAANEATFRCRQKPRDSSFDPIRGWYAV